MIAYVRDAGGGAAAQSAFWSLIGLSAFVTPWVWRRVLALDRGGLATTIILGTNAIGASLPIFGHSPLLLAISALVFGGSKTILRGRVSNIARPSDVAGVYGAAGAGLAVGRGARAIVLTNQKGAVLELSGRQVGLMANVDLSGLAITLK